MFIRAIYPERGVLTVLIMEVWDFAATNIRDLRHKISKSWILADRIGLTAEKPCLSGLQDWVSFQRIRMFFLHPRWTKWQFSGKNQQFFGDDRDIWLVLSSIGWNWRGARIDHFKQYPCCLWRYYRKCNVLVTESNMDNPVKSGNLEYLSFQSERYISARYRSFIALMIVALSNSPWSSLTPAICFQFLLASSRYHRLTPSIYIRSSLTINICFQTMGLLFSIYMFLVPILTGCSQAWRL